MELVDEGRAQHIEDEGQLVVIVLAWEEGLAAQHLGEDAANRPDIDRLGVHPEREHDLRGTVPSCCDVCSQFDRSR